MINNNPHDDVWILEQENKRLKDAIRKHRDQRGDNRCWLDDVELYKALREPFDEKEFALHCPAEMLKNCERYIASRQPNGVPYVSPQKEIDEYKALIAKLPRHKGKRKPIVFVAGPYSDPDPVLNVNKIARECNTLFTNNPEVVVLCPMVHLFMQHTIVPRIYAFWLDICLDYLKMADLYFRFPGKSSGCDKEEDLCKELGIPVVRSWQELNDWVNVYYRHPN